MLSHLSLFNAIKPQAVKAVFPVFLALICMFSLTSQADAPSQIKELGGLILLDSTVEVTGALKVGKWVDLVEVSTPTTPSTDHAALWLNTQPNGKQALKIIFDNGTVVSIAAN